MVLIFPDHGDTAAACRDDSVLRVHQRAHGLNFNNLYGLRARDDLTPAAACVLGNVNALFCGQLLGLFLGHERADGLGRMLEGGVGGVDGDLREDRRAVNAEASAVELFADDVL